MARDWALKKTQLEACQERTGLAIEAAFQFREKLQPLAWLCEVCNLNCFPGGHRVVSKSELVLILLTSLVEAAVSEFGWRVWHHVELEASLKLLIQWLHERPCIHSLPSHTLVSETEIAITPRFIKHYQIHYLLALCIIKHGLCLTWDAIW